MPKVTLCLLILVLLVSMGSVAAIDSDPTTEMNVPEDETLFEEIPIQWTLVKKEDAADTLRMLTSMSSYNRGVIKTYSANYAIDTTLLTPGFEAIILITQENQDKVNKDLYRHLSFTAEIIADVDAQKTFKKVLYNEDVIKDGNTVIDAGTAPPFDVASVTTAREYLSYKPDMEIMNLQELPGFSVGNKKIAWVEPPEKNEKMNYMADLDPFEYYAQKPWGSLDYFLECLEGKYGEDDQKKSYDISSLYEATDKNGVKWFRFHEFLHSYMGGTVELNTLWNEACGLMPVFSTLTNPKGGLDYMLQVKWECQNGVYVPAETLYLAYRDDGKLRHRRKMVITDTKVNEKIDSKAFSFKSLGLPDGSFVVDRIQQKVFTCKKDKLVFIADFYSKQIPKKSLFEKYSLSKGRTLIVVLGFAMIFIAFYLKGKRNKE